jgi:hypothetical protein
MLGWEMIITNGDKKIASWMVGFDGTDWLRDLAKEGLAKDVAVNSGYPHVFSAPAKVLIPILKNGIPQTGGGLVIGEDYALLGNKIWDLVINTEHLNQCLPDDELTIEAWDQS